MRSLNIKLVQSLVVLVVPLTALLIVQNLYATRVVRDKAEESTRTIVEFYMERTDRDLVDVAGYLRATLIANEDLIAMQAATGDDAYTLAKIRLLNRLSKDVLLYRSIDCAYVYYRKRSDYIEASLLTNVSSEVFAERMGVKEAVLRGLASEGEAAGPNSWKVASIGGRGYLIHETTIGDLSVGAWVSMERLVAPMRKVDVGKKGAVLFLSPEGRRLTEAAVAEGAPGYLSMRVPSGAGPFALEALVSEDEVLRSLPYFQALISLATIGAILFFPAYLLILRRTVLKPLRALVDSTRRLRSGDLDHRVEGMGSCLEFEELVESYNAMLDDIQGLKIDVYEEQLAAQRAEFQRLQAQVKPHFFMNSLNVIYSLAQLGRTEKIQALVMDLAGYFRYMLRDEVDTLPLREEIGLVRSYLRIQEARNPEALVAEIDVPEEAEGFQVPPLCIQTFAENALKHAVTMDSPLQLRIIASIEDDGRLRIEVEDDGAGYPPHAIAAFSGNKRVSDAEGEHIGIWNLRRRLALLYGDRASLECRNAEGGGATAILLIPGPEPTAPTLATAVR
jgi:Predicted signal transduction protein with a C-terminal ATPase domain